MDDREREQLYRFGQRHPSVLVAPLVLWAIAIPSLAVWYFAVPVWPAVEWLAKSNVGQGVAIFVAAFVGGVIGTIYSRTR